MLDSLCICLWIIQDHPSPEKINNEGNQFTKISDACAYSLLTFSTTMSPGHIVTIKCRKGLPNGLKFHIHMHSYNWDPAQTGDLRLAIVMFF